MKLEFSRTEFRKNNEISNFMKIRPVGVELFHADELTDRLTDMTKLIVAFFTNFANAPKKSPFEVYETKFSTITYWT